MIHLLPLIVAFAAAPSPAPSTEPPPTPLTEIGRVRAQPVCVPIVAHANGAINDALESNRALTVVSTNLRNTNYNALNDLQRRNAIEAILRHAEAIGRAAKAGEEEVRRLREYAANSPDPNRKEELKTFADALGGAMYRQKKVAMEIQRDIAILNGRELAQESREQLRVDGPTAVQNMHAVPTPAPPRVTPTPDPRYDQHLKVLADKLDVLNQGILRDEGVAADHSIAATSGC